MCWFLLNSGSYLGCYFCMLPCNLEKVTIPLVLLSELDTITLFVQVFEEFIDFVFAYSSDRIIKAMLHC